MKRVCVYCGSSNQVSDTYKAEAFAFGERLAERRIGLVYGGGATGLMGQVADGALAQGGEVIGVIPEKLAVLERGHQGVTRLIVVDSMHTRKFTMAAESDGFVALPGGFGTFEEIFEAITWSQLNIHIKPLGFLNVDGYYDGLLRFLDHARDEGFVGDVHRQMIAADTRADALLDTMISSEIPKLSDWIHDW